MFSKSPILSTLPLSLLLFLSSSPLVKSHGYLNSVTIDGVLHQGTNVPTGQAVDSPIRAVNSIDPVKGATNKDLNCGASAQKAKLVADAKPGSTIEFMWKSGENTDWPHNTGPMITYMATCGNTTCDQYDSTQAKWFKISEVGKSNATAWTQAELMLGKPFTMNLPNDIAPGQYLIRHEIIALQLATSEGGAEFYPTCTQVKISGNATGKATSQEEVSFPGAYTDTEPGILDPDVFNPGSNYTFPGPAIAKFASSSGSGSSGSSNSTSSSSSGSSSSCKAKRSNRRMMKKRLSANH